MAFIYESEVAAVEASVNGKAGVSVHLEPEDEYFGEGDGNYMGDELLFESRDVALEWARALVSKLEA